MSDAFDAPLTDETPLPVVDQLHHDLVAEAGIESSVSLPQVFWSAVGAGLAIAFSFLGAAAAMAASPPGWSHVAAAVAYPLGFLIVIGGRYQLFTENTLPPVARVLERLDTIPSLLRLWTVVLLGNFVGAVAIGVLLSQPGVLPAPVAESGRSLLTFLHPVAPGTVFVRALLAGWLVAAMVWLLHRMERASALPVIWACTALMPLLHLEHVVVGTVEATFAVASGLASIGTVSRHLALALAGNTLGGVLLVTLLNHARTRAAAAIHPRLPWRHWLFGLPRPIEPPEVLHGIQGRIHWWLNAPGGAPVPSGLYETPAQLARVARDFGASKLVLHGRDGLVRVLDLDRESVEIPLTSQ